MTTFIGQKAFNENRSVMSKTNAIVAGNAMEKGGKLDATFEKRIISLIKEALNDNRSVVVNDCESTVYKETQHLAVNSGYKVIYLNFSDREKNKDTIDMFTLLQRYRTMETFLRIGDELTGRARDLDKDTDEIREAIETAVFRQRFENNIRVKDDNEYTWSDFVKEHKAVQNITRASWVYDGYQDYREFREGAERPFIIYLDSDNSSAFSDICNAFALLMADSQHFNGNKGTMFLINHYYLHDPIHTPDVFTDSVVNVIESDKPDNVILFTNGYDHLVFIYNPAQYGSEPAKRNNAEHIWEKMDVICIGHLFPDSNSSSEARRHIPAKYYRTSALREKYGKTYDILDDVLPFITRVNANILNRNLEAFGKAFTTLLTLVGMITVMKIVEPEAIGIDIFEKTTLLPAMKAMLPPLYFLVLVCAVMLILFSDRHREGLIELVVMEYIWAQILVHLLIVESSFNKCLYISAAIAVLMHIVSALLQVFLLKLQGRELTNVWKTEK